MNEKQRRSLCLGDSNTFGYDPSGQPAFVYPPKIRWTGRLQSSGWTVFNSGINGSRVPVQSEFPALSALIESKQPLDVITIMYGTNDLLQGDTALKVGDRMAIFLSAAHNSAGSAAILLIAPPQLTFGDWVQDAAIIDESRRLSDVYRKIAQEKGIAFADAGKWGVALTFDGVHFTAEGHEAFFHGLEQALSASAEG